MVAALSPIGDGSPQRFSSVAPAARVIPASGTLTSVTTVTTLGRWSSTWGEDARAWIFSHACGVDRKRVLRIRGDSGDGGDENHDLRGTGRERCSTAVFMKVERRTGSRSGQS